MAVTQLLSSMRLDRAAPVASREPWRASSTRAAPQPAFSLDRTDAPDTKPVPTPAPPRSQDAVSRTRESRPSATDKTRDNARARPDPVSTAASDKPALSKPTAEEPASEVAFATAAKAGVLDARTDEDETREPASDPASVTEAVMPMPEAVPRPAPPMPTGSASATPATDDSPDAPSSGTTQPVPASGAPMTAGDAKAPQGPMPAQPTDAAPQALGGLGLAGSPLLGADTPPAEVTPGAEPDATASIATNAASARVGVEVAVDGLAVGAAGARRRSPPTANPATPAAALTPSPLSGPAQAAVAAFDAAPASEADAKVEPKADPAGTPSPGKEPAAAPELPSVFSAVPAPTPPSPTSLVPAAPSSTLTGAAEAGVSAAASASVTDAGNAAAASMTAAATGAPPVPLGAVPMTIAMRALQDARRFEIRLDPIELGRIDVRLDIDRDDGSVRADLVVDRPATLALLQRDAGVLQDALSQAGLDASAGINLSLRDGSPQSQAGQSQSQSQSQGQSLGHDQGGRGRPGRNRPDETASRAATESPAPIRLRPIGIDIRI